MPAPNLLWPLRFTPFGTMWTKPLNGWIAPGAPAIQTLGGYFGTPTSRVTKMTRGSQHCAARLVCPRQQKLRLRNNGATAGSVSLEISYATNRASQAIERALKFPD